MRICLADAYADNFISAYLAEIFTVLLMDGIGNVVSATACMMSVLGECQTPSYLRGPGGSPSGFVHVHSVMRPMFESSHGVLR